MYLICVDTKTEAVHPCDLREIGVQHHVKNAFIDGALPDATRGIAQAVRKIIQLQIVAEIVVALFEFGESRDARGDRWLRQEVVCRFGRVPVATCARAKSPVNPAEPAPRTRQTENRRQIGAGEGNRTLVFSLEGCCSTIELHPRSSCHGPRADGGPHRHVSGAPRIDEPIRQVRAPSKSGTSRFRSMCLGLLQRMRGTKATSGKILFCQFPQNYVFSGPIGASRASRV